MMRIQESIDSRKAFGDKFAEALWNENDLFAILRTHLFVEHSVNTILLESMPGSEPFLRKIDFLDRAEIARKLDLFDDPGVIRAIRALTKIRNDFAHNLSRERLTDADDDALVTSLKGTELGKAYHRGSKEHPLDTSRPGMVSRLVLIVLVVHLSSLEGSLRHPPRNLDQVLQWYGVTEDELLKLLDIDDA